MELWDIYDKNGNKVSTDFVRDGGRQLKEGEYHLAVHIWLRDKDGRYLISRRAPSRPKFPLMWECPGGSVLKGETGLEGAVREVFEEVGVRLDAKEGKLLFKKVRDVEDGRVFRDILEVWQFVIVCDADLADATTDEVDSTKWATRSDIEAMFASGEFVPTLRYVLDLE